MLADGRRQIGCFYWPGDVFGLEGDEHTFSAEAVVNSRVSVIKRTALFDSRDPHIARQLWGMAAAELQRAQDHMMLLVKSAQERVAAFLIEMSKRSSGNNVVDLPMSRQDIADYLGLTIETVSRTLSHLESCGAISLQSARRIMLCSHGTLRHFNA